MALAYAALGNGGTIVTPHVGMEIQDAAGRALKEFDPEPQRQVKINPTYRAAIMEGLHEAAQAPGGTSASIFEAFPIEIAGKTGTAERPGHGNQSWYAALAPYPNPRIVTVLTIEEGGFGAESAAPAVKQSSKPISPSSSKKKTKKANRPNSKQASKKQQVDDVPGPDQTSPR